MVAAEQAPRDPGCVVRGGSLSRAETWGSARPRNLRAASRVFLEGVEGERPPFHPAGSTRGSFEKTGLNGLGRVCNVWGGTVGCFPCCWGNPIPWLRTEMRWAARVQGVGRRCRGPMPKGLKRLCISCLEPLCEENGITWREGVPAISARCVVPE